MALSSKFPTQDDNLAGEGGREDAVAELPHFSRGYVIGKVMEYCIERSLTLSKYVGAGQSIDGKTIVENLWRCAAHALEIEEEATPAVLPHDLLAEEVLTRLPAKSLMRFRRVSKLWCSTICDSCFVKAHSARSRSRSAGGDLLLVCPSDHDDADLSFDFFRASLPSRPIPEGPR